LVFESSLVVKFLRLGVLSQNKMTTEYEWRLPRNLIEKGGRLGYSIRKGLAVDF